MIIFQASAGDADSLARVINLAFNPAEESFAFGDRITPDAVRELCTKGAFLASDDFAGCVYVEPRGDRAYLGLLSVDPACQGTGLGRKLMAAAEDFARAKGSRVMDLRVVDVRTDLPPFYQKLGYASSGTEAWPEDTPTKVPCSFLCMSKALV